MTPGVFGAGVAFCAPYKTRAGQTLALPPRFPKDSTVYAPNRWQQSSLGYAAFLLPHNLSQYLRSGTAWRHTRPTALSRSRRWVPATPCRCVTWPHHHVGEMLGHGHAGDVFPLRLTIPSFPAPRSTPIATQRLYETSRLARRPVRRVAPRRPVEPTPPSANSLINGPPTKRRTRKSADCPQLSDRRCGNRNRPEPFRHSGRSANLNRGWPPRGARQ